MPASSFIPIFELTRGETVESTHCGAVAVVEASGRLVASFGNPRAASFLRSSAKPFQALPLLENGGQEAFELNLREIALICASHSGTDEHVAVVREFQARAGIREAELLCGVHPPFHQPTLKAMQALGEQPTPNRNNCSGKHTGMLAYARLKDPSFSLDTGSPPYIDPAHPVQKDILHAFAEMCALPASEVARGTDGCSVPTFAVPLFNAALAYARLCDPEAGRVSPPKRARACRTITTAMTAHPEMVGGPDSFDTRLMRAGGGRILSKAGAEGYQALGLLPGALGPGSPALGIAIKIADGDLGAHSRPAGDPFGHVRPAVVLEVLSQLGALSRSELEALASYGPSFQVHNWQKIVVGEGRPCFKLRREV